ncbi:hypothetical protein [Nocardioides iriomotensis]|uniref:ABC transporter substrate-binding protein n=1 Tax=Nocardioides iriomotensis TaxID=715784 RepID=A0A4Q5IXH6_9ACTN|nr:hypothetical protein [Nocardioides iriomotensis]RYU10663.1 hypothetical protein ETU37_15495 [Nocardioides iriomotensis]
MRELIGHSWRGTRSSIVLTVVAAVLASLVATSAHAAAAPTIAGATAQSTSAATTGPVYKNEFGKLKSRVVGSFGNNGTVEGVFKPKKFKTVGGQLVAVGKLQADLVKGNGRVLDTVSQKVSMPVATANGATPLARATCDVLSLVLAPLDLDLLGLQVHLDRVVLNIVAVSGAGNLLGNLLCAITGLLDQGGLLTQVSQILNAILALLRT